MQTDRHTYRQINLLTDRQTYRHVKRQTDLHTCTETDRQTYRHVKRQTDLQTCKETDRHTHRHVKRQTDLQTDRLMKREYIKWNSTAAAIIWYSTGTAVEYLLLPVFVNVQLVVFVFLIFHQLFLLVSLVVCFHRRMGKMLCNCFHSSYSWSNISDINQVILC